MGLIWSKSEYKLSPEMLKEVKIETGFTTRQVNRLFSRFQQLDHDNTQYLTKEDLGHIKEVRISLTNMGGNKSQTEIALILIPIPFRSF
jgi:hypothetical protein